MQNGDQNAFTNPEGDIVEARTVNRQAVKLGLKKQPVEHRRGRLGVFRIERLAYYLMSVIVADLT